MSSIRITFAAILLTGAAATAAIGQAAPANNNAQAGMKDMGANAPTGVQAQSANPADANARIAANTSAGASTPVLSSEPSPTQVAEAKLRGSAAKQRSFDEQAQTTKELNEQATQLARNGIR